MKRLRAKKKERRWALRMRRYEHRRLGPGAHRHYWQTGLASMLRAGDVPTIWVPADLNHLPEQPPPGSRLWIASSAGVRSAYEFLSEQRFFGGKLRCAMRRTLRAVK